MSEPTSPAQGSPLERMVSGRMCKGKKRFRTKIAALGRASGELRKRDCETATFRAYECPICKGWHLTSKPANDLKLSDCGGRAQPLRKGGWGRRWWEQRL